MPGKRMTKGASMITLMFATVVALAVFAFAAEAGVG